MFKTADGVTTITTSREHHRNAVDGPTGRKLYDAFIAFENDPSQKVCVFYGDHGNFCAGFDLHEASTWSDCSKADTYQGPIVDSEHRVQGGNLGPIGPSRLDIKKPVISAVAGYAVAGGLELSLLCDLRVVEENATSGIFCRRWGVPLVDGGTVRVQAITGLSRALDMILTGRPVGAQDHTQWACSVNGAADFHVCVEGALDCRWRD